MKVIIKLTTLNACSETAFENNQTILVSSCGDIITDFQTIPLSYEAIDWFLKTLSAEEKTELPEIDFEIESFGEGADNFSFEKWDIEFDVFDGKPKNVSVKRTKQGNSV